jgi:hypothetical protein
LSYFSTLKNSSIGVKQQSLTQKVTSSPMIKLKNSSIGVNQQSLTQKVTCSPMIKLKNSSIGVKQQSHGRTSYFLSK